MTRTQPQRQAVVIGAGVAGLMAARVLQAHFDQVLVLERDRLEPARARKGTPQAQHTHILLDAGAAVLKTLFPTVAADMSGAGCWAVDAAADLRWFHFGVWKKRFRSDNVMYLVHRPTFEASLRSAVEALPGVSIRGHTTVKGLVQDARGAVVGVAALDGASQTPSVVPCAVVIDASGRGSRMDRWLHELGVGPIERSEVAIDMAYVSYCSRPARDFPTESVPLAVFPEPPRGRRIGIIYPVPGDRLMVTLAGLVGDHPPTDVEGHRAFAAALPVAEFGDLLAACPVEGGVHQHRLPTACRRHFERAALPEGVLVMGDALCSLNPVFGQGMSVAALQADVIRQAFARAERRRRAAPDLEGLQAKIAAACDVPWQMGVCENLRFPEVAGPRTRRLRALQWYLSRIYRASAKYRVVCDGFLRVMNLTRRPSSLFAPRIALRVLGFTLFDALRTRRGAWAGAGARAGVER